MIREATEQLWHCLHFSLLNEDKAPGSLLSLALLWAGSWMRWPAEVSFHLQSRCASAFVHPTLDSPPVTVDVAGCLPFSNTCTKESRARECPFGQLRCFVKGSGTSRCENLRLSATPPGNPLLFPVSYSPCFSQGSCLHQPAPIYSVGSADLFWNADFTCPSLPLPNKINHARLSPLSLFSTNWFFFQCCVPWKLLVNRRSLKERVPLSCV